MSIINLILSILSEAIPAGIPEKAQHRLRIKVNNPTPVYERLNSVLIRGSNGAILAGKTWIKTWEKVIKENSILSLSSFLINIYYPEEFLSKKNCKNKNSIF